jgi:hypothetical protein
LKGRFNPWFKKPVAAVAIHLYKGIASVD